MVAPVLQREGARIGGLTATTVAGVLRTDSAGTRLFMDIYSDSSRKNLVTSSAAATLNAGNNYQATCYVTGLTPNTKYWYAMRADDGVNSTVGTESAWTAGSFKTAPTSLAKRRICLTACNPISPYNYDTSVVGLVWARLASLGVDMSFNMGDCYYSDNGTDNATPDYTSGAWRNPINDAAATINAYRTNFITTHSEMQRRGEYNWLAHYYANTPTGWMWDDHDRGWNDMDGVTTWTAGQITRATNAQQVAQESYMDLNSIYLTSDGRTYDRSYNGPNYYHVDIPGARIIVTDNRSFRSLRTITDDASKTMLGATQLAWVKNKILTNPQPNLILANPLMFDGYHGWNESLNDGWVAYNNERDSLLQYIWDHGNPARTVIYSGDTHAGNIARFRGAGKANYPIYEIAGGNLWPQSLHGFINGWCGGASGLGGEQMVMRVNEPNACLIDISSDGTMRAQLYEPRTGKTAWAFQYS